MQGFGPVVVEHDEPVFHSQWEGRVFGLVASAFGASLFNGASFRHAIERMDPAHYLASSYYEHWMTSLATLIVESGKAARDELERRAGAFPLSHPARVGPDDVESTTAPTAPRFAIGDRIRVGDVQFAGHTRCPRYVCGHAGVVVRIDSGAIPELEAHRRERVYESIYCVRFTAQELWGERAEPDAVVHLDLYESYLEQDALRAAPEGGTANLLGRVVGEAIADKVGGAAGATGDPTGDTGEIA
jgi:nitrile hydratase